MKHLDYLSDEPIEQRTWFPTRTVPDMKKLREFVESLGRVVTSMQYREPPSPGGRGTVEVCWHAKKVDE